MYFDHIRTQEQQRQLLNMRAIKLSGNPAKLQDGFEELKQTQEQ